jgi:ParB-like chromosome segregation protein Spo0J
MATATERKETDETELESLSKKELQQEMAKTRESVSETVDEIKQTVTRQYEAAKETVAGVMDYRKEFQKEPLVWSLGALSAGFALGYTMGYAHKETKGGKNKSEVMAFTNSLVDELSLVGSNVVMPTLNARISELFGFNFSDVLDSIGKAKKTSPKRKATKKRLAGKSKRTRKTAAKKK